MKRILLLLLSFFLIFQLAYAQDFSVGHDLLTSDVYPGSEAVFKVVIVNEKSSTETFTILKDELAAIPFSDKFEYTTLESDYITLKPNSEQEITLRIKLLQNIAPNKNYKTYIIVKDSKGTELVHDILVPVSTPEEIIKIDANLPDRIIPGQEVKFNLKFRNSLNLILEKVNIEISGDLIQDSITQKFFPYQELEKEFALKLPTSQKPGTYKISIKAYQQNKLKGSFEKTIRLIENPEVKEVTQIESGFLLKIIKVKKTNYGNTIVEDIYTLPVSSFEKPFIKSAPEPTYKKVSTFEWHSSIAPDESYEITIRKNYRLLAIIILSSASIIVLTLYALSRKLTVKKAVFKVKEDREGISELKVLLHIRNRGIPLKNIQLVDTIPHLVKPTNDFGTLKPTKIQKGPSSIRLVWDIPDLLTGDERIISYKIESHLHIIGRLVLPRAIVQYRKDKKHMKVRSNKVTFFSLRNK